MEYAFTVVVLLLALSVAFYMREARAWRDERAQLLDRLMARNWGEYIQGTREVDSTPIQQLSTDELEAAWYAAKNREAA